MKTKLDNDGCVGPLFGCVIPILIVFGLIAYFFIFIK